MSERDLRPHEISALVFLIPGPDTIGVVDTEEKMAAALVFDELRRRGFVIANVGADGPSYRLTPAGRTIAEDALRNLHGKCALT